MTLSIDLTVRNAMLEVLRTAIDAGSGNAKIAVYDGTRPATVNTALSGNTKLVEFTLNDPATTAASSGVVPLVISPIVTATAVASGTATFYRLVDPSGTVVQDGSVGTTGQDLNLSSTAISSGQIVYVTSGNVAQLPG